MGLPYQGDALTPRLAKKKVCLLAAFFFLSLPYSWRGALDTAASSFYPHIMQMSPLHRHHHHHHHVANVSAEHSEQVS
jgi:hypothetical protein